MRAPTPALTETAGEVGSLGSDTPRVSMTSSFIALLLSWGFCFHGFLLSAGFAAGGFAGGGLIGSRKTLIRIIMKSLLAVLRWCGVPRGTITKSPFLISIVLPSLMFGLRHSPGSISFGAA